jgi:hypothetical protein
MNRCRCRRTGAGTTQFPRHLERAPGRRSLPPIEDYWTNHNDHPRAGSIGTRASRRPAAPPPGRPAARPTAGPNGPRCVPRLSPSPLPLGGASATQERARRRPGYLRARLGGRNETEITLPIRSLDDFLIRIGYEGCYDLVIIVTAVSVNQPRDFLPKSCAYQGSFWHS